MTWLLSLLGWGKIALAWIAKLPWYVLALAGCAAVILWQHGAEVRKDARIASLTATLDQVKVAQVQAATMARETLHHQEQAYEAKAQDADYAYEKQLAAAHAAADRYVDAHRVRVTTSANSASPTVASSKSRNSGVPASLPGDAIVVSSRDVQACTAAVTYAVKAHDWAANLGQQ